MKRSAAPVSDVQTISRVAAFARWLPLHAHLVGEIVLEVERQPDGHNEDPQHALCVLDTLLACSGAVNALVRKQQRAAQRSGAARAACSHPDQPQLPLANA